jgi:hypothetical protein
MTLFSPFALLRLLLMGAAPNQSFQLQAIPFARGGGMGFKTCTREEGESSKKRERESYTKAINL